MPCCHLSSSLILTLSLLPTFLSFIFPLISLSAYLSFYESHQAIHLLFHICIVYILSCSNDKIDEAVQQYNSNIIPSYIYWMDIMSWALQRNRKAIDKCKMSFLFLEKKFFCKRNYKKLSHVHIHTYTHKQTHLRANSPNMICLMYKHIKVTYVTNGSVQEEALSTHMKYDLLHAIYN